jgi:hypothetical protein
MMKPTLLLLASCLVGLTLSVGCAAVPGAGHSFEFASGGANHPSGAGEWRIKLDGAGAISVVHDVQGKVQEYGTATLAAGVSADLWSLIEAARLAEVKSSTRPPMPDEVAYTFILREGGRTHNVRIWVTEAADSQALVELVQGIGALIEQQTQVKPVLR